MSNEVEILRDLPFLNEKISQCEKSKLDFERAIIKEHASITDLESLIRQNETSILSGKRQLYDIAALAANIKRHKSNIELFMSSIEKEDVFIARMRDIISVLKEDLVRPKNEVIFDMRDKPQHRS